MKQDKQVSRLFKVLVEGGASRTAGVRSAAGCAFNGRTAERIVIPQHTTWGSF